MARQSATERQPFTTMNARKLKKHQTRDHRFLFFIMLLIALLLALAGIWRVLATPENGSSGRRTPIGPAAYAPSSAQAMPMPAQRLYTIEKHAPGYMLMVTDAPGHTMPVALLPDKFGAEDTDSVAALTVAPGHHYIAIDGQSEQSDTVWIVATQDNTLRQLPADASGNFLHWLPDGQHFLFRPFLSDGPFVNTWHPGVWIVDAASGTHIDLPLPEGMPANALVDAIPAPDGRQVLLSLTAGLGSGSAVWEISPDGLTQQHLFDSDGIVGLFAWSPNGQQIAYQQLADSSVPYRPAGLWLMSATATERHQIGEADGGHGYTLSWSPDSQQLAFVARLNASDNQADGQADALVSAVSSYSLSTKSVAIVATPAQTGAPRNINPVWRPDGTLLFTAMAASDGNRTALSSTSLWSASDDIASATGSTEDIHHYSISHLSNGPVLNGNATVATVP